MAQTTTGTAYRRWLILVSRVLTDLPLIANAFPLTGLHLLLGRASDIRAPLLFAEVEDQRSIQRLVPLLLWLADEDSAQPEELVLSLVGSLTASIIQFIDFGVRFVKACHEISTSAPGATAENVEMEPVVKELEDVSKSLGQHVNTGGRPGSTDDQALQDFGSRVSRSGGRALGYARELQGEENRIIQIVDGDQRRDSCMLCMASTKVGPVNGGRDGISTLLHTKRYEDSSDCTLVEMLDELDRTRRWDWTRDTAHDGHHWSAQLKFGDMYPSKCNFVIWAASCGLFLFVEEKFRHMNDEECARLGGYVLAGTLERPGLHLPRRVL